MLKPKILAVEDMLETQLVIQNTFSKLGCEVILAPSGEEALEILKEVLKVDCVILDFKLPGMSGPQFYRKLAMDMRWNRIPVVPFTSQATDPNPSKLVSEWISQTEAYKELIGEETPGLVAKSKEVETTIPPELILSVAGAIKQNEKELPVPFQEAVAKIFKAEKPA